MHCLYYRRTSIHELLDLYDFTVPEVSTVQYSNSVLPAQSVTATSLWFKVSIRVKC
jgi:hypothetical protein